MNFNTGVYYQDILADGTRSVFRQNFPTLKRVSFDRRPQVVQTLKITVEELDGPIYAAPSPTPAQEEMIELGKSEAIVRMAKDLNIPVLDCPATPGLSDVIFSKELKQ